MGFFLWVGRYGVVSCVNPNMIHQIFIESVVGCPVSHVYGENLESMPVQGLEQPTHPENSTSGHKQCLLLNDVMHDHTSSHDLPHLLNVQLLSWVPNNGPS
jgi:hypothetical protein